MSVITDVALFTGDHVFDEKWVKAIEAIGLKRVERSFGREVGGTKVWTEPIFAGSFNYFDIPLTVATIRSLQLDHAHWVLVIAHEFDEKGPRVYWPDGERINGVVSKVGED